MEGEIREGDIRVPLIASVFCLTLIAGGVLLGIYVFDPDHSKPWFPAIALTLIAMPWIFWVLMYFYTCIKACLGFRGAARVDDRQVSRRSYQSRNTMGRKSTANEAAAAGAVNNNAGSEDDVKHVKFGGAVVMEEENDGGGGEEEEGDTSIASRESEKPLKLSVSSSSS